MVKIAIAAKSARALVPALAALALVACTAEEEAPTYEADAEDLSGGELIVNPEDPAAVDVDLPETEMTPVPEGAEEAPVEDAAPAE